MCGIAGELRLDGSRPDSHQLRNMISTLHHRGPDASGVHVVGPVGLASARLSIIDLEGGVQPMANVDGDVWITFNGEIFNYIEVRNELIRRGHRFATHSDTEVILNAYREYGEDCVNYLNGQWAFAIWDSKCRKLFLSRDRLGIRPLFYTKTARNFLFGSEIKALFASGKVPAELDCHGLDQTFTFWHTLPPRTIFRDICQLPPGSSMVIQGGDSHIWKYWSLEYGAVGDPTECNERKAAEELLSLLTDATRIRLRSDVPVAAYLSGGIDSTVTTALLRQLAGERLRSFSVSFADVDFDESRYQREASSFLRTQHSDITCSYEDIANVFPQVIWHTEQPIIRTAPAPLFLLSRMVRDSGFKVVLTGEGADETLGGYDIFKEVKIRRFWGKSLDSNWRPLLLKRLYPYMKDLQRQSSAYLKNFFCVDREGLKNPFFSHLPRWELTAKSKVFFSDAIRSQCSPDQALSDLERALPRTFEKWCDFNQAEYLECSYLLPGYILSSQGDRMAMANSVEGRYPFLDHRVVEFAAKLPPTFKMKVLDQKHLLKIASSGLIPDSIRRRPKQPYRAPDGKSFFKPAIPDYVNELLSQDALKQNGIFDERAVKSLLNKFEAGRANGVKDNMALVGILSTQILIDQFVNRKRTLHEYTNNLDLGCCHK